MDVQTRKVIKEFVMEHFLRRLAIACPRCGKEVTIQFSLEGGPVAKYEEEEQTASIETGEMLRKNGIPKEFSEEFIDRIVAAIESREKRQTS